MKGVILYFQFHVSKPQIEIKDFRQLFKFPHPILNSLLWRVRNPQVSASSSPRRCLCMIQIKIFQNWLGWFQAQSQKNSKSSCFEAQPLLVFAPKIWFLDRCSHKSFLGLSPVTLRRFESWWSFPAARFRSWGPEF